MFVKLPKIENPICSVVSEILTDELNNFLLFIIELCSHKLNLCFRLCQIKYLHFDHSAKISHRIKTVQKIALEMSKLTNIAIHYGLTDRL